MAFATGHERRVVHLIHIETYARTRTDHPRLDGSEHSVSRSDERVAAFKVFESGTIWSERYSQNERVTHQQNRAYPGWFDMIQGSKLHHTQEDRAQAHDPLHLHRGCKALRLLVWENGRCMTR